MATGYIFTKTSNSSTKVVHVTNDVVDLGRTKIFKGPVLIEDNDPSLISIKEGGGNAMSLNISAIITIDGSAPAGTMQGVIDQLDAVFPKASTSAGSGGGAVIAFNANIPFTNTNSIMNKTVTGAIAFAPNTTGAVAGNGASLRIIADGSHTPTFSAAFKQLSTSDVYDDTADFVHEIFFYYNGIDYLYSIAQIGVVDTTAPVLSSANAPSLHTINALMAESVSGTIAGWSAKQNGVVITPDSVSGTTTRALVFSETFLNSDTLLLSYDAGTGDTVDGSGNPLASFTDHAVTNNISSGYATLGSTSGTITETPAHSFVGATGAYAVLTGSSSSSIAFIQAEVGSANNEIGVIGLDEDNTLENYTNGGGTPVWNWFMFLYSGNYFVRDAAGSQIDTGIAYAAGHLYQIVTNGTTVTPQYSTNGGSTWNNLYPTSGSYPTARSSAGAAVYGKIGYAAGATIKNLKFS